MKRNRKSAREASEQSRLASEAFQPPAQPGAYGFAYGQKTPAFETANGEIIPLTSLHHGEDGEYYDDEDSVYKQSDARRSMGGEGSVLSGVGVGYGRRNTPPPASNSNLKTLSPPPQPTLLHSQSQHPSQHSQYYSEPSTPYSDGVGAPYPNYASYPPSSSYAPPPLPSREQSNSTIYYPSSTTEYTPPVPQHNPYYSPQGQQPSSYGPQYHDDSFAQPPPPPQSVGVAPSYQTEWDAQGQGMGHQQEGTTLYHHQEGYEGYIPPPPPQEGQRRY